MKKNILFIIYPLGIFLLYPIIRYIYFFVITTSTTEADKFVFTRVYFSGPLLIIIGLCMFLLFNPNFALQPIYPHNLLIFNVF